MDVVGTRHIVFFYEIHKTHAEVQSSLDLREKLLRKHPFLKGNKKKWYSSGFSKGDGKTLLAPFLKYEDKND